jgi:two-component system, LytTR family, response regulator
MLRRLVILIKPKKMNQPTITKFRKVSLLNRSNTTGSKILTLENQEKKLTQKIVVYNSGIHHLIDIDDIIMIQAQSNYTMIYLANGTKMLTSKTLKYWHEFINNPKMIRFHASYLVHKDHIINIDKKQQILALTGGNLARFSRDQAKFVSGLFNKN